VSCERARVSRGFGAIVPAFLAAMFLGALAVSVEAQPLAMASVGFEGLLSAAPAVAPTRAPPGIPSYGHMLLRTLATLVGLLGAFLLVAWLLSRWVKRRRTRSPGELLEVVDTCRLDAKSFLHLVRVGKRYVLVGSGPDPMVVSAGELDHEEIAAALGSVGASELPRRSGFARELASRSGTGEKEQDHARDGSGGGDGRP